MLFLRTRTILFMRIRTIHVVMVPMRLAPALVVSLLRAAEAAGPIPPQQLFNKVDVTQAPAVCNRGSAYSFYYRNCSANWDRKPGGPNYCLVDLETWIIYFADDPIDWPQVPAHGPFCYDSGSCTTRPSNLTSTEQLPDTLFPGGIVLPFAEANPNLYKAHSIVAPSCSSDLWTGNGSAAVGNETWRFSGSLIVDAILATAFYGLPYGSLASADRVILSGGPGIMARLDELADRLLDMKRKATGNSSAALIVLGLCDGCLIMDVPPFLPPGSPALCQSDSDCPPATALPLLSAFVSLTRPAWCNANETWECYTATHLLPALQAARTPTLVFQQQFDEVQLESYGAGGPGNASLQWAQQVFAPAVRAAVSSVPYSFAASCSAPSHVSLSSAWYHTLVHHVDTFGHIHNDSMNVAAPTWLDDADPGGFGPEAFGTWRDECTNGVEHGCNPSGCAL